MTHIMIDLEFMDTSPPSAITAIGAVVFDPIEGSTGAKFYVPVDLESSVKHGGTMSASTVLWWLKQSEEARAEFKKPSEYITAALISFSKWVLQFDERDNIKIWGNGAASDNVILRTAYERLQMEPPWSFRNDRCYRTLRALTPDIEFEPVGTAHHALDDAYAQALHLNKVFAELGLNN
jgi:hypothetical protein